MDQDRLPYELLVVSGTWAFAPKPQLQDRECPLFLPHVQKQWPKLFVNLFCFFSPEYGVKKWYWGLWLLGETPSTCVHPVLLLQCHQSRGDPPRRNSHTSRSGTIHIQVSGGYLRLCQHSPARTRASGDTFGSLLSVALLVSGEIPPQSSVGRVKLLHVLLRNATLSCPSWLLSTSGLLGIPPISFTHT